MIFVHVGVNKPGTRSGRMAIESRKEQMIDLVDTSAHVINKETPMGGQ